MILISEEIVIKKNISVVCAALALDPLIGAISAGNTVILKPSDQAPACSSFLAYTIPLYLDCKAIKVIEGGAETCERLLQQKWEKIFFTGIHHFQGLPCFN